MKRWKVTAELNMDASDEKSMIIKANTARAAIAIDEKKFMK